MRSIWRWLWTKGWRRRLTMAVGLVVIATPVSVEVTSQSKFCNSCHIMGTYYSSWKAGSHRQVDCVECHIAPGTTNFIAAKLNGLGQVVDDVLDRTSTKPSASVSDFSCTRSGCHVIGELGAVDKEGRSYRFDHDKHFNMNYRGISVHCTTCHSHVMGKNHFEVNTNVCVSCHLIEHHRSDAAAIAASGTTILASLEEKSPASSPDAGSPSTAYSKPAPTNCDACHTPPEKPVKYQGLTIVHSEFLRFGATCVSCHRNATEKAKPIENDKCYACHDFGVERFTNVQDLHRTHAEGKHKVECLDCHGLIRHGPDAQAMSLGQFDCQSCHRGQHVVQRVTYSNGQSPTEPPAEHAAVSPMFMVHVDCTGCHIKPGTLSMKPTSGATVNKAVATACDNCHRPGLGEQMVPMWQKTTHELYDGVAALMPTTENPWTAGHADAETLVQEAQQLLELVRVDGSWGVHNPKYTQRLIEQARERVVKARQLSDKDSTAKQ